MASNGTQGDGSSPSLYSSISDDGRFIAFHSFARNLVDNDTNYESDIFVHDQQTGETVRVSVASDGTEGNGRSWDKSISADGRFVAFSSNASNLVSNDTNGVMDIFVHELAGSSGGPDYDVEPVYPQSHFSASGVMQGGKVSRHLRLVNSSGSPIPNATVTFSIGAPATTDAAGYFIYTIAADTLGGPAQHSINIESVSYGGQTYDTGGQPAFPITVTAREYAHSWGYGAARQAKGGVSLGAIAYLQGETSSGMTLSLAESDPAITTDDVVSMEDWYSDQVGFGAGAGLEKKINVSVLEVKGGAAATAEYAWRALGRNESRYDQPYQSAQQQAQGIFLLSSLLQSMEELSVSNPFMLQLLRRGLTTSSLYEDYLVSQQAGSGVQLTPLQSNVGATMSLGFLQNSLPWKQRVLGFEALDVGSSMLTLQDLTYYADKNELGLGTEVEIETDFSFGNWNVGPISNKFSGHVGTEVKKVRLEVIQDADSGILQRLEITFSGEGNPFTFTDVVKEEVVATVIIPADQLTPAARQQSEIILRLIEAAQQTGSDPLGLGSLQIMTELDRLLQYVDYFEYETTVSGGAETNYEPRIGIALGLDLELGGGLEVKKSRAQVRERGVFLDGKLYVTEQYDNYNTSPGKSWAELTANALNGLWLLVKDSFTHVWQQIIPGEGWNLGILSRTAGGLVRGGARLEAAPGTKWQRVDVDPATPAIQNTEPITVTAVSWVPGETTAAASLPNVEPAVAATSGDGFAVGGVYEFQPGNLTLTPAASLVISYTDTALGGVSENQLGLFRWQPESNNWQPVTAQADPANNRFTADVMQLGTFAVGYDAVGPEISVVQPVDGSTVANRYPPLQALLLDEGTGMAAETVTMKLDGETVPATYIPTTGELLYLPSKPLANGVHTVRVSGADAAGNVKMVTATFIVDVTEDTYLPLILRP